MSEQIKEALLTLDPKNDDHWTGEGLPRLDVMKDLLGSDVSRSDVTQTSKSFTRKNPTVEEVADTDGNETPETPAPEATTPEEDSTDESPEEGDAEQDDEQDEDAAIEQELEDAQGVLNEAQKRYKKALNAMDVVITKRAKVDARVTDAHTIQAFQKAQHKAREQKAARKKRLNELLGE